MSIREFMWSAPMPSLPLCECSVQFCVFLQRSSALAHTQLCAYTQVRAATGGAQKRRRGGLPERGICSTRRNEWSFDRTRAFDSVAQRQRSGFAVLW